MSQQEIEHLVDRNNSVSGLIQFFKDKEPPTRRQLFQLKRLLMKTRYRNTDEEALSAFITPPSL